MSDQLIIKMGGQIVDTVELDRPMMRIGRGEGCDIRLEDPEKRISRFHAVIQRSSGRDEFKIKNDEGKTGVLVNNNRADDWVVLKRGDLIQIGPFSLIYSYGAAAGDPDDADATMVAFDAGEDLTMVGNEMPAAMPPAGQPQTVQHDATMVMPGGGASGEPLKLVFVKGPFKGGQQTVTTPSFTIGRSQEQNAVWLKDDTVSTQHAEVSQVAGKYFIKDLGSQNGLLVNGKKVIGESDLKNGDKITIGLSTFKVASGAGGGGGGGAVKILSALVGVLAVAAAAYFGYQAMSEKGGSGDGGNSAGAGNGEVVGGSTEGTDPDVTGTDTPPVETGSTPAVADAGAAADNDKAALEAKIKQLEADAAAKAAADAKAAEMAAADAKAKMEAEAKMQMEKDAAAAAAKVAADAEMAAKMKAEADAAALAANTPPAVTTPPPVTTPPVTTPPVTTPPVTTPPVTATTPAVTTPETTPPVTTPPVTAAAGGAAAAAGDLFKAGPVDPARKIMPAEAIEYKQY